MRNLRGLIAVLIFCSSVIAIPRDRMYPYGRDQDDRILNVGDDISSTEIPLRLPITFYDQQHNSIFVNLNGHLSFETELPSYKSDLVLPIGFKVIVPFLADIDTRLSGNVYYRETQDTALLERAEREVRQNFPGRAGFRPRSMFIATWEDVGYYNQQFDKTNTFQVVIASDGVDSFVTFNYPEDGIQWVQSEGKSAPSFEDVPAQGGFDAGDRRGNRRVYLLPASGNPEARNWIGWSNAGVRGVWMFRVGDLQGNGIETPETHTPGEGDGGVDSSASTCSDGGDRACHPNGHCEDFATGYCCRCDSPYIGNGLNCLLPEAGEAQRVTGKVTGSVNGVDLGEGDLHGFVFPRDGRTFTAVSRPPPAIGYALQSLFTMAGGLGWLFAEPTIPQATNGFMQSGGLVNRTVAVRYTSGGETVNIRQQFLGQDAQGFMRTTTSIVGNVPNIDPSAKVQVGDYKEDYTRTAPGNVKSQTTLTYTVDGVPYHVSVDQTYSFAECEHRPFQGQATQRLSVSRNFLAFVPEDQIVRVAQTNKVTTTVDADECALNTHDCHEFARCLNTEGSFECQCLPGYRGDGRDCTPEPCNVVNNCDVNAQCVYDASFGTYSCQCNPGYSGSGTTCEPETCDVLNNCDPNARCVYDERQDSYRCVCNPGHQGDGLRCRPAVEDCSVENFCSRDAQCVYDYDARRYRCRCNDGFEGDGRTCTEIEVSCNVVNNCDFNADCIYDPRRGTYQCQCRQGYEGDGFSCRLTADCRRDPRICDVNARCERRGVDFVCICLPGYQGDGYRCSSVGDAETFLLLAQGTSIMRLPFNPTENDRGRPIISIPGQTAIGVDADCYSRYFYWTDVSGKTISRARLDGTDSDVLVSGLGSPEGIAIDWVSKNMYWTDSVLDRIEVSRLDGTSRKTLFYENLVNPRAVVVDPISGVMFWSDWNREEPKIETANMDGTERTLLVSEGLGLPNGLAIDFETHLVCWADAGTMHLECMKYDGRGRRTIYALASYPFSLTYANNIFYWSDWDVKSLPNINKYADEPNESLLPPVGGNGRFYGITTVRSQCPLGSNACAANNGGCRFLCLPYTNGRRTCTCPDDIDEEECNRISLLE